MQPLVEVDGTGESADFSRYTESNKATFRTVGSLCMEDVIGHERERAFARRTITVSDSAKWSGITFEGAGRLEDILVFIPGPTGEEGRPLKLKNLVFADSRDTSKGCYCSALSSDGKLLAASFGTRDVLVWRLFDGLLVQRLQHRGHTGIVNSLSFSTNNRTLVSASDHDAIVWDTRSGRVLLRLEGHHGLVGAVAYAPNGALIAIASNGDNSVKIWDALTGACLYSFSVGEDIYKLTFSSDSSRLCTELDDSYLLYNMKPYTPIATLRHDSRGVLFGSMSRQGDRIVTVSSSQVNVWSAETGDEIFAVNHPQQLAWPVTFSPDGAEVLVVCRAHNTAVTYDSRTGQLHRIFNLSSLARCAVYSPDGDYVVFGDVGNELQVFDATSGTFLAEFEAGGDLRDIQFVPNSNALLMKFKDRPLVLCNIRDIMRMR